MPVGRPGDCPCVVAGAWGAGAAAGACAKAEAAQRHAAPERRNPVVALKNTADREESPQDIKVRSYAPRADARRSRTAPARKIDPATTTVRLAARAVSTASPTSGHATTGREASTALTHEASSLAVRARGVSAAVATTEEVTGSSSRRIASASLSRMMPTTSAGRSGCHRARY